MAEAVRLIRLEVGGTWTAEQEAEVRAVAGGLAVEFTGVPGPARAWAGAELRWVHSWAAGVDGLTGWREATVVTSAKGNGAVPLAEHAMLLTLMLDRDAARWAAAQAGRRWERRTHSELLGRTMGILGLGRAGRELRTRAEAFGMPVVALRRDHSPADLDAFCTASDVLVVCAPLTDETRGMLGDRQFDQLGPTGHYVCVSRGGIADDAALLRALQENRIAGAGLDAHAVEPLPEDSPFWDLPNVIVTPHNGATTPGTARRGFEIFLGNLGRFIRGEGLEHRVDVEAGY
ncbi:NAD(P)-dependent oxidoreductase [Kineococcus gynurae]|uniref:NAD(P)-dependent oxidoreductase n=1 Tax=Kineococcus gynurae TaxID=452979 RepID=A0ABV5LN03_9ACTN